MKLIVATSFRQAEWCARNLGLRRPEWKYVGRPGDLRGYASEVDVHVVEPFLGYPHYWPDVLAEVDRLKAEGATVRTEWT